MWFACEKGKYIVAIGNPVQRQIMLHISESMYLCNMPCLPPKVELSIFTPQILSSLMPFEQ
jgi:hypothetical protein